MFYITEKAAFMVQMSAEASGSEGMMLRVSASLDSHGQPVYRMGFDDPKDGDQRWNSNGIDVLVQTKDQELLREVALDFQDLPGSGPQFAFVTLREAPEPQAPAGCPALRNTALKGE